MEAPASGWRFLFLSSLAPLWMTAYQRGPAKPWADHSVLDENRLEVPKHCCSLEALKNTNNWLPLPDVLIYGV